MSAIWPERFVQITFSLFQRTPVLYCHIFSEFFSASQKKNQDISETIKILHRAIEGRSVSAICPSQKIRQISYVCSRPPSACFAQTFDVFDTYASEWYRIADVEVSTPLHSSTGSESIHVSWHGNQVCGSTVLSNDESMISTSQVVRPCRSFGSGEITSWRNNRSFLFWEFRQFTSVGLRRSLIPSFILLETNARWIFPSFLISFLSLERNALHWVMRNTDQQLQNCLFASRLITRFQEKRAKFDENFAPLPDEQQTIIFIWTKKNTWEAFLFTSSASWRSISGTNDVRNLTLKIWHKLFVN